MNRLYIRFNGRLALGLIIAVLLMGASNCSIKQDAGAQPTPGARTATQNPATQKPGSVLKGKAALGDWTTDAPNGDIFVAESYPGRVRVLRAADGAGKPEANEIFAADLDRPFGIAFYPPGPNPQYVYVANTGSVVRFPYRNGDLKARDKPEMIVPDIPGGGQLRGGGHWTRDIAFSRDGKKMFVSVGSHSNVYENPNENEERRADILECNPDGTGFRIYASGIRNAVGIAVHPQTGELWASVNERDGLGDDLVPDYITRVKDGGFYV